MYGSQASKLCLRTSDLDLVIVSEYEPFLFLEQIKKYKIFEVKT
jgi:DNA polymerase sigma